MEPDIPQPTLNDGEVLIRVYRNPDGVWVAVVREPGEPTPWHRPFFEEGQ